MAPPKLRPWLEVKSAAALNSEGMLNSGTDEWLQVLNCHLFDSGIVFMELSDSSHRVRAFLSPACAARVYSSMEWDWSDLTTTFVKSIKGELKTTPRPFRREPELILWMTHVDVYGAAGSSLQGNPGNLSETSVALFQRIYMLSPADRLRVCPELPVVRLLDANLGWGAGGIWRWSDFIVPPDQRKKLHALFPEATNNRPLIVHESESFVAGSDWQKTPHPHEKVAVVSASSGLQLSRTHDEFVCGSPLVSSCSAPPSLNPELVNLPLPIHSSFTSIADTDTLIELLASPTILSIPISVASEKSRSSPNNSHEVVSEDASVAKSTKKSLASVSKRRQTPRVRLPWLPSSFSSWSAASHTNLFSEFSSANDSKTLPKKTAGKRGRSVGLA
jgi:hypothetical protein